MLTVNSPDRLIRLPEVTRITGASKSSIYRWMEAGTFPRAVKIGPKAIAWPASVIANWQRSLTERPNTAPQK